MSSVSAFELGEIDSPVDPFVAERIAEQIQVERRKKILEYALLVYGSDSDQYKIAAENVRIDQDVARATKRIGDAADKWDNIVYEGLNDFRRKIYEGPPPPETTQHPYMTARSEQELSFIDKIPIGDLYLAIGITAVAIKYFDLI